MATKTKASKTTVARNKVSKKQTTSRKKPVKKNILRRFRLNVVWGVLAAGLISVALYSMLFAATVASTGGPIVGIGSKCLDNKNSVVANNNPVQLWQCTGGVNQKWSWTGDDTLRVQGLCLDAPTGSVSVFVSQCSGATSQKWLPQKNGSLINLATNLCLDDKNSLTTNGNTIWTYTCNGSTAQKWNINQAVIPLSSTDPAPHSPLPTGTLYTAKPTITLDYSEAPEFGVWAQGTLLPIVSDWYRVLGDRYAYPSYVPYKSLSIKVDGRYTGAAYTSGSNIVIGADFFRARMYDAPGAVLHEVTHVIQGNPNGGTNLPGWVIEGMADYTREHVYNDRAARPATSTETYLNGYSPAANLLYYAEKYDAGLVKKINVAGWKRTYTDSLFKTLTGRTIAQLWTEMTGQPITNPGPISNAYSGKCFDLPNYSTSDGTLIQLQTCNGSDAEKWIFAGINKSSTTGVIRGYTGNKCLDVAYSGLTDGTKVWYWNCNYSAAQTWVIQDNGALKNLNSGKCLQPVGKSTLDGTKLEISTCDGSAHQNWKLMPLVFAL